MIIDCISDLHGHHPKLEGGDLLIVGGDLTARDTKEEYIKLIEWSDHYSFLYKKVVFIAGNHDNLVQKHAVEILPTFCEYLCDSGCEFSYIIDGLPEEDEGFLPSGKRTLKIWGSPWTKTFEGMNPHCKAFTVDTEEELGEKWAMIPEDVDILITHSPPRGYLDHKKPTRQQQIENWNPFEHGMGSTSLLERTRYIDDNMEFKRKLHVCGHIHEGYGKLLISNMLHDMCTWRLVNASHVNERYEPVNAPIRIVL